jgi:(E)-4-hydroxy-3-methylbut-2-enyl-diphosphate synthase
MIHRHPTKQISVGKVKIGGEAPISVQSMVKSKATGEIIREIQELESSGCELVRIAVPDFKETKRIREIKKETQIPIIADIHYNYKLAIKSIEEGVDKIRINPGNIGGKDKVKEIVRCLKEYNIPMRIGVNSGSLEAHLLQKYGAPTANALKESILQWVNIIEDMGFTQLVLSVKSSDPLIMMESYRLVAQECNYPLHIGVTAVGGGMCGIVRSAIGIGSLLCDGIGDTIRVSLTGSSIEEVKVGKEILLSLGLRKGIQIISCPTCGRCEIDVLGVAEELRNKLSSYKITSSIRIAVMGCIVNGPGEARDADLGVTGSQRKGVIFKKGKIIKRVLKNEIIDALLRELKL